MSHQPHSIHSADPGDDTARAFTRLCATLALVETMADMPPSPVPSSDDIADLAAGLLVVPSVTRRRFDALLRETAGFAAAGLAALLRQREQKGAESAPAAAYLARELRSSITVLEAMLRASRY